MKVQSSSASCSKKETLSSTFGMLIHIYVHVACDKGYWLRLVASEENCSSIIFISTILKYSSDLLPVTLSVKELVWVRVPFGSTLEPRQVYTPSCSQLSEVIDNTLQTVVLSVVLVTVISCAVSKALPSLSHTKVGAGYPVALQVNVRSVPKVLDIVAGSGVTCTGTACVCGCNYIHNTFSFH